MIGEANFSDHGANRLGASALMQGLADGYFVIPNTIGNFFASSKQPKVSTSHPEFRKTEEEVRHSPPEAVVNPGKRTVSSFHRELGKLMWEKCGMARNEKGLMRSVAAHPGPTSGILGKRQCVGHGEELNQSLEHAGRVADFMEFAELLCLDALTRAESCGGHFREEFQTEDGEALRNDEQFAFVSAWEYQGPDRPALLHKEPLIYDEVKMTQRSYK